MAYRLQNLKSAAFGRICFPEVFNSPPTEDHGNTCHFALVTGRKERSALLYRKIFIFESNCFLQQIMICQSTELDILISIAHFIRLKTEAIWTKQSDRYLYESLDLSFLLNRISWGNGPQTMLHAC